MDLIDAPIHAEEEDDEYAAYDIANTLRKVKHGGQHKLTLVAGHCFKKLVRCWQPGRQPLLE